MTDTPSLPAQIEAVRDVLGSYEAMAGPGASRSVILWRAVRVNLQQHERLEAALRVVLSYAEAQPPNAFERINAVARAALDTAAASSPKHTDHEITIFFNNRADAESAFDAIEKLPEVIDIGTMLLLSTGGPAPAALGTAAPETPTQRRRWISLARWRHKKRQSEYEILTSTAKHSARPARSMRAITSRFTKLMMATGMCARPTSFKMAGLSGSISPRPPS